MFSIRHALALALMLSAAACPPAERGEGDGTGLWYLASGVEIDSLVLYQGLEIPLVDAYEAVDDGEVRIVRDRDALLRVFTDLNGDWEDRDVVFHLRVQTGEEDEDGQPVVEHLEEQREPGPSAVGDLDSTANFEIPGEWITADTSFQVSIREVEEAERIEGATERAQWPQDVEDWHDLDARRTGGIVVKIIPIRYNADGSGRLPDTSDSQLDRIREGFESMYPLSDFDLVVDEPMNWQDAIQPNGTGWDDLLNTLMYLRNDADEEAMVYYYGLFDAASSFGAFCSQGCVAGLSPVGSASDVYSRASIGVGFTGQDTVDTMLHEVGHAHGRNHSPCSDFGGIDGVDPNYPHENAYLGRWGYNKGRHRLIEPEAHDVMAYCSNIWISDYTYEGIADRIRAVADQARYVLPADFRSTWSSVMVDGEGVVVGRGYDFELDRLPGGEPVEVEFLDAAGAVVEAATASFHRYSHLPGGVLLFPRPGDDVRSIRGAGLVPFAFSPVH